MALTPEKEALKAKLNEQAERDYQQAFEKAARAGKPVSVPKPAPLEDEQLNYPKWLYGADGQAKLVLDAAEHKGLGAGWDEAPIKPSAKAEKKG